MAKNPLAGRLRDRRSNRQLAEGELQLECDSGAVSVAADHRAGTTTLRRRRRVAGRKAQVARLNRDQVAELVGLLLDAGAALVDGAAAPE